MKKNANIRHVTTFRSSIIFLRRALLLRSDRKLDNFSNYLEEVEALEDVDTEDDVDTELEVEALKWRKVVIKMDVLCTDRAVIGLLVRITYRFILKMLRYILKK